MQFPRLNLARYGLSKLTVEAEYGWAPEYEGWLEDFLVSEQDSVHPIGPDFIALTVTHYRSRDTTQAPHVLVAFATRDEESPDWLRIDLRYSADEDDLRLWENARAILRRGPRLATHVFSLGQAEHIDIGSEARIRPLNPDDLWFPLPSRVEDPLGPVEIRGVRGVRYRADEQDEIDYVFTIDRPIGDSVFLSLQWNADRMVLDHTLLKRALRRSSEIQTDLIQPTIGGNDAIRPS